MKKIKRILHMDRVVNELMEEQENKNLKGIYSIIWIIAFVFTIYNIIQKSYSMMISTGILVTVLSIGLIANYIKKNNTLLRFLFTSLFFVMFSIYIIKGGNEGFATLWIVVISYPLMVIIDLKMGFVCCFGWAVVLFLFFLGPLHPYLQYEYQPMFLSRFPALYTGTFACATFIAVKLRSFQYYALKSNQELEYIGCFDELTGLHNLRSFRKIVAAMEDTEQKVAFALIDVDLFKSVNDTYGHAVGDEILKRVAQLMKSTFRDDDVLCRIGGDEFSILLRNVEEKSFSDFKQRINTINATLQKEEILPKVSLSVGIAFSTTGYDEELYNHADTAMYSVKKNGGCGCCKYN